MRFSHDEKKRWTCCVNKKKTCASETRRKLGAVLRVAYVMFDQRHPTLSHVLDKKKQWQGMAYGGVLMIDSSCVILATSS
jgi:hypothetical protein